MARQHTRIHTKSGYNTTVARDANGHVMVTLYKTCIARIDDKAGIIKLNTGGFNTPTTFRRMNAALIEYGFPQRVGKADFKGSSCLTLHKEHNS